MPPLPRPLARRAVRGGKVDESSGPRQASIECPKVPRQERGDPGTGRHWQNETPRTGRRVGRHAEGIAPEAAGLEICCELVRASLDLDMVQALRGRAPLGERAEADPGILAQNLP